MTEQEKRERVIRGLECCFDALVQDEHAFAENGVVMSSWQDRAKRIDAIREAIAFLKAQEPRVMTISDFKDEGVYYLEALPPFVLRPVIYRLDHSDPRHYNFVWKYDQFTWNTDEYGKTWRCWTSRPTDDQREATPWQK